MSRYPILFLSLLSIACSGDGVSGECAEGEMTLELGTGVREFEPLTAGDPVVMVHGPQGGWHVDLTGALTNTGQEVGLFPSLTLLRNDGVPLTNEASDFVALSNYDNEACTGEFVGRQLRFSVDGLSITQVCNAHMESAELEVTVEDFGADRTVTESITVTLQATQEDLNQCAR